MFFCSWWIGADPPDNDAADFRTLQDAGIVIICYFSAGTYEEWREDESTFPASTLGSKVVFDGEFFGEWWVNINDEARMCVFVVACRVWERRSRKGALTE